MDKMPHFGDIFEIKQTGQMELTTKQTAQIAMLKGNKSSRVMYVKKVGKDYEVMKIIKKYSRPCLSCYIDGERYFVKRISLHIDPFLLIEDQHSKIDYESLQTLAEKLKIKTDNNKSPQYDKNQKIDSINGFAVRDTINPKAIITRVILTNYEFKKCPVCHGSLLPNTAAVEIPQRKYLLVPGKKCGTCDSFFESGGNRLVHLFQEIKITGVELNSNYLMPNLHNLLSTARKIHSSYMAFHLISNSNEHRLITIVFQRTDASKEYDLVHYTSMSARRLLLAYIRKQTAVEVDNKDYYILNTFPFNGVENDHFSIDTIFLYSGGGLMHFKNDSRNVNVDILLYSPVTGCLEVTHASYDTVEKEYFMDLQVFRRFVAQYGNPGVKIRAYDSWKREYGLMELQEESLLHVFGYTVAQNSDLSSYGRQKILAEVMDLELMTPHQIINLLSMNIKMRPSAKYENACGRWKDDIEFVSNYKVNPQRFIVSSIGIK